MVQQDGKKLVSGANMQIDRLAGRCSLHIGAVTGDDEAEYRCEARNEFGVASTVQQLLVNCRYLYLSASTARGSCLLAYLHVVSDCCIFSSCHRGVYSSLRPKSLQERGAKNEVEMTNLYTSGLCLVAKMIV